MASKDAILEILESRYDYHAARVIFRDLHATAALEEQRSYGPDEIGKLAEALVRVGERAEAAVDALNGLATEAKAKATKAAEAKSEKEKASAASESEGAKTAKKPASSRSRSKS